MKRGTHALKVIGLGLVILPCLALISASGAKAGTYTVLGSPLAETAEATVEADGSGVLKVPAINLEIACSKVDTSEGKLLILGVSHVALSLLECATYAISPLALLVGCEIYPTAADRMAGTNKGTIAVKALVRVISHEG